MGKCFIVCIATINIYCMYVCTVKTLNKGHFRTDSFVLCKEVVFGRFKCTGTIGKKYLRPQAVSFVEMLSLFQIIHNQRFHCYSSEHTTKMIVTGLVTTTKPIDVV